MFGIMKKKSGSPYHTIDYSNKDFYTGKCVWVVIKNYKMTITLIYVELT